ncbi:MAG: hypothetical protein Q9190_004236 [Brigantiaea leucoxantha]
MSKDSVRCHFDVIDTSNLGDHIGLINMLTACAPLLRPRTTSSLYTESLLAASGNASTSLSALLGINTKTFSMLTGIVPHGLESGVTLENIANEVMLQILAKSGSRGDQRQYRLRVQWKYPAAIEGLNKQAAQQDDISRTGVKFKPQELAACLHTVYKGMFAEEDMSTLFSRMQRKQSEVFSTDMQRYTRAVFVALLRLVKTRVIVDWDRLITQLLDSIESDQSLVVGSNSFQELSMHLASFGVWTVDALAAGPRQALGKLGLPLRPRSSKDGLLGEEDVPPVVYLVLGVPRRRLEVLTKRNPDKMGTPGLHISVRQQAGYSQFENCFHSIHCAFGRLRLDAEDGRILSFSEDQDGWLGSADLVVVCAVPSFGLLTGPRDGLEVSLSLNASPEAVMMFSSSLGPTLTLFETSINDTKRVTVSKDAPYLDSVKQASAQHAWIKSQMDERRYTSTALAKLDAKHNLVELQIRTSFENGSKESKALLNGAFVSVEDVSLCTVLVRIGSDSSRMLEFPSPVRGSQSKTRIARKSSWIEIECPIFTAPEVDTHDSWTKVSVSMNGVSTLSSLSRVDVRIQPVIELGKSKQHSWLSTLMGSSLSQSERLINDRGGDLPMSPKLDLKQSLNIMLQSFAGLHPQSPKSIRIFQLTLKENKSCHTLIFVNRMLHDLDLGSVVLDAWVLPLTISRVKKLGSSLARVQETGPLGVFLSEKESILWKRLLPALAERCRTWNHGTKCEYQKKGVIPLSTAEDQNPLCSCGEGKDSKNAAELMKGWGAIAKYATRIAIAPIFPVPYIEAVGAEQLDDQVQKKKKKKKDKGPTCDGCGKTVERLQTCGGCGLVRYCSRECQKGAWKGHKMLCKKQTNQ